MFVIATSIYFLRQLFTLFLIPEQISNRYEIARVKVKNAKYIGNHVITRLFSQDEAIIMSNLLAINLFLF